MPLKRHPARYHLTEAHLRVKRARAAGTLTWGRRPVFWDQPSTVVAAGTIAIGDDVLSYNDPLPARLAAAPGATLTIGDRVLLNYGIEVYAAASIEIGDDSMIGDLATVYDTDFHPVDAESETRVAPVKIGSNVWICRLAIVLPGVEIGDHAVVAAGAVVTRDVASRTVVAGNPAKVIRADIPAVEGWNRHPAA
jgi:acetyltransferase-like isoleucine patch superfamily enzyme